MNFRRIISKNSLRSTSSSGKSLPHSEEVIKLHSEIETLRQTVESLKVTLESRDAAVGNLAREKEKLYIELKSAQRTNRNLHQQLVDERDIHSKEKEYLIADIKRLSKNEEYQIIQEQEKCVSLDEQRECSLKEEIKAKDEIICNVCAKYMKIKFSKKLLQKKYDKLLRQSQSTCEDIILLLQDNRKMLDNLLLKLINNSTLLPDSKKYLRLLKNNANLHYENTQLKLCFSQKDFPKQFEEDKSNPRDCITPRKISKSEARFKKPKIQSFHSYSPHLRNSQLRGQLFKDFQKVHEKFCRGIYYSNSDPCLARF